MKAFEYADPKTESELLQVLSPEIGHTELLAGGTDLVVLMKKMTLTPDRVVNLMQVDSIQGIEPLDDGGVKIGAAVHLDDLLAIPYLENYAAVVQAIRGIGSMQLLAQGTLGGEICQRPRCWYFRGGQGLLAAGGRDVEAGDSRHHAIFANAGPAKFVSSSRIAPALVALEAQLRVIGPENDQGQLLAIESFYRAPRYEGQRETVLLPNQVVTHILLPPPEDGRVSATYEVRPSEGPDDPLAAAAVALRLSGGVVREAKIVLGQVAPIPWISHHAAQALVGLPVDQITAEAAGRAAISSATPLADNQYKVQLAQVAVKRAILLAAGEETGGF